MFNTNRKDRKEIYLFPSPISSIDLSRLDMVNLHDISMGTEKLQASILNKASSISHLVTELTLGPNSSRTSFEEPMQKPRHTKNAIVINQKTSNSTIVDWLPTAPAISLDESKTKYENPAGIIEKLLYDLELQRKVGVQETMKFRLGKLEEQTQRRQSEIGRCKANLKCVAEDRAFLENQKIQHQMQELAYQESQRQAKLAIEQQKRDNERKKLIKEAEKQAVALEESNREKEKKRCQLSKMKKYTCDFNEKFAQLENIKLQCKDRQELQRSCLSYDNVVKSLYTAMQQLSQRWSIGEVNDLELDTAYAIVQQLDNCSKSIEDVVNKINKNLLERIAAEEEKATASVNLNTTLEATKAIQETTLVSSKLNETLPALSDPTKSIDTPVIKDNLGYLDGCINRESLQEFLFFKEYLANYQRSLLDLKQDPKCKDFVFNCKKAVNIPVNAISDISGSHLHDKFKKLTYLLLGQPVELSNCRFSATGHPQGIAYCMDLLANKLVSQGKATVSSKPEGAFPIAAIIVALWAEFPEFGKLIQAHFQRECPYLVPVFLPQVEGQSDVEYYKSLGYHYDENGQVEKQNKFLKKMSGIMRLYCAVMISELRQRQTSAHPHSLGQAWRWIACIVNLDPRRDISATLILDFLEVTGSSMCAAYGQQFQKLLHLLCTQYFPKIQKLNNVGGPVSRLEAFLQGILKKGNIPRPRGVLPPNFW